jgi:hypothetical protein
MVANENPGTSGIFARMSKSDVGRPSRRDEDATAKTGSRFS